MPKISAEMKFPCGFEIKLKSSSLFLVPNLELYEGLCPLHGKECVEQKDGE